MPPDPPRGLVPLALDSHAFGVRKLLTNIPRSTPAVNVVFGLSVLFSNVVGFLSVFCRSLVFNKSYIQPVSAGLTNVSGLAIGAFNLVNCTLSVLRLFFVFNVSQYMP